ncbi:MAG: DUF5706 domain-containing protein [Firmicutes bacterium]|nr:DUF5706 domain-containing protein [Bacillota bacterium]
MKEKEKLDIILHNHNLVISWISNVDFKISIATVLLSIILYQNSFSGIYKDFYLSDHWYRHIVLVYFFVMVLSLMLFLCGLLGRLSIRKNKNIKSLIFFGSISGMEFKEYKKAIKESEEDRILTDLIEQTYINSKICKTKFIFYNLGLYLFGLGVIINLMIMIIYYLVLV